MYEEDDRRWCRAFDLWRFNGGDCLEERRELEMGSDRNPRLTEAVRATDAIVRSKRWRLTAESGI